jgi:uncharacterized membrane protein YhaH (DUF805 family)
MDYNHLLFSPAGRIPRRSFWRGMAILIAASVVLNLSLAGLFGISQEELLYHIHSRSLLWLDLVVNLILFWPGYVITVKRLHDRSRGPGLAALAYGLYLAALLMQLAGLDGRPEAPSDSFVLTSLALLAVTMFLVIDLGFLRGERGANSYGADPIASA